MLKEVLAGSLRVGDKYLDRKVVGIEYLSQHGFVIAIHIHCEGLNQPYIVNPKIRIWQEREEEKVKSYTEVGTPDLSELHISSCIAGAENLVTKLRQYSSLRAVPTKGDGTIPLGDMHVDKTLLVQTALKEIHDIGNALKQHIGRL